MAELTIKEKKKLAKELGLRPKTRDFIDEIQNNPKISATKAYLNTHETTNRTTAKVNASQLLSKPSVQIYAQRLENKAKKRIAGLLDSDKEEIVLRASQDILDRNIGKAVQKSVSLTANISFETALNDLELIDL